LKGPRQSTLPAIHELKLHFELMDYACCEGGDGAGTGKSHVNKIIVQNNSV